MAVTELELSLPPIRATLAEAKADLDEWGVARVADALSPAEVAALRTRLEEQAEAERAEGVAFIDGGGANQRVWNLVSKGEVFRELLTRPLVRELAGHVLEGDYCLSSHTANIAGPGGEPMVLHSDQGYAPRTVPFALAMNVMWMLCDFTDDNGATRVVPGSHRLAREPDRDAYARSLPGTGPAGTALIFDGRIWHGTGANTTADAYRWGVLTYFVRPWVRPQENYTLSTHPDVLRDASPELLGLLGLRVWRTLGGVQGPWGPGTPDRQGFRTDTIVSRDVPLIGELRP